MTTTVKYSFHSGKKMRHNNLNTGISVSFDHQTESGRIYVNSGEKYHEYKPTFRPLCEL